MQQTSSDTKIDAGPALEEDVYLQVMGTQTRTIVCQAQLLKNQGTKD